MSTSCNLYKDENGKPFEESKYRGMTCSLLYPTASCHDIMFVVCMCSRFQVSLNESHFNSMKIIMRYLSGTQQIGLWYPKGKDCDLLRYSDFDFVGCKLNRKSIISTRHLLGNSIISWNINK